jgi:hypothetical protein
MGKDNFHPSPYTVAAQPPHQDLRYGTMAPPVQQQTHTSMLPSPSPSYQPSSSYSLPPQHPPPMPPQAPAQTPATIQSPADPLEQRVLDLLYPYRDECFNDEKDVSATQERMALILCGVFSARVLLSAAHARLRLHIRSTNAPLENIAFLIHHNQASYGKSIEPNDVSIVSRNWQMMKEGRGAAGIGIFVNGNGFTHTVLRVTVKNSESAIGRFTSQVNEILQTFFPDL